MTRLVLPKRGRLTSAIVFAFWMGWRLFRLAVGTPAMDVDWTEGTRLLARDARVLGDRAGAGGLHGKSVTLSAVSPRLLSAILTSEDRDFRAHDGVDRLAIARALWLDLRRQRIVAGGSTITAQLVKRLDWRGRSRPRGLLAKLVETARAQNLDARADKDAILRAYLDHLDYGHGLAGPEAAAQGYFGVAARDVSLAQAALLAVVPRAPSALDPRRHLDRAVLRQRALLHAMHARREIDDADLDRALAEGITIAPARPGRLVAPHVVLATKEAGDVHTTLDFDLQTEAEAIVRAQAATLRARGATGAAVVVVDNATGDVLAEVGSADYFDRSSQGAVDVVRRRRQAGSTLKPFVYALAFERGMSPMAPLADVPTELGTTGAVYAPDNFDGVFVGPVAAREALAGSLNVPAVRLTRDLGARDVLSVLRAVGLELAGGIERFGLSIALGSGEVSPLELASAYATLARGGEHVVVGDRPGARTRVRVLSAEAAALVGDALSDPLARVRGLHARGPFELPFPVAVKTGTSTGFRDAWTAGYTRERTVVVWIGNASGIPTDKLTGAGGAGPIFTATMARAMRDLTRAPLASGNLLEEAEVCPLSGDRPGDACPDHVTRRFVRGHAPRATCAMHRHATHGACDPAGREAIVVLPNTFARFLGERPRGAPGLDAHGLPWLSDAPGCSAAPADDVQITVVRPADGAIVETGGTPNADVVEVVVERGRLPDAAMLDVVVDGEMRLALGKTTRGLVPITRGDHDIEVRPHDERTAARVGHASIRVR